MGLLSSLSYTSIPMLAFIVRRLVLTLPVVWIVVTLVFGLIHMVPGDPVVAMLDVHIDALSGNDRARNRFDDLFHHPRRAVRHRERHPQGPRRRSLYWLPQLAGNFSSQLCAGSDAHPVLFGNTGIAAGFRPRRIFAFDSAGRHAGRGPGCDDHSDGAWFHARRDSPGLRSNGARQGTRRTRCAFPTCPAQWIDSRDHRPWPPGGDAADRRHHH